MEVGNLADQFRDLLAEQYLEEAIADHVDTGRENLVVSRMREIAALLS